MRHKTVWLDRMIDCTYPQNRMGRAATAAATSAATAAATAAEAVTTI